MFEAKWTPLQMCMSCSRLSGRSEWPSQCKRFTTCSSPCLRDAEQLLALEKDTHSTECVSLSRKMPGDEVFLGREDINFDLSDLQNEIWWTWFFVEFSNIKSVSKTNQICVSFFEQYSKTDTERSAKALCALSMWTDWIFFFKGFTSVFKSICGLVRFKKKC